MYSLDVIWDQAKNIIQKTLSEEKNEIVYTTFVKDAKLAELDEKHAVILVDFYVNKIALSNDISFIENALSEVLGHPITCDVLMQSEYSNASTTDSKPDNTQVKPDNIMPEYTFDNFVVGPSNKESYSAALACAMNPNRPMYNPLFIYGDSGLGKTHLLHAIGNYLKQHAPEKKVLYLAASTFVNEVYVAIRDKRIEDFKSQMNSLDMLLVDDIQALSGKEKSHEIFFNVYNELFNNRKQIILTSDRRPQDIKEIEERMISRFSQGLSVSITSPEFETAYKILEMKIKTQNIDHSSFSPEVLSFLATNFSSDIRNLEGALNRLLFWSINFSKDKTIDLPQAMEAFQGHLSSNRDANSIEVKDVINAVADYYGLTRQQLISKSRTKHIATARHIAMYLCRKNLDVSYLKIGEEFGNRDHSTVLTACDKVSKLVKDNESYRKAVADIESKLFNK